MCLRLVDAHSDAVVGASTRDEEDSKAVVESFDDARDRSWRWLQRKYPDTGARKLCAQFLRYHHQRH